MAGTRKIAAILVADIVGYSRLAGADEDRTLSRLRGLRSDLIDPAIDAHHGRIVKHTGDGSLIEFRSVVDAVRCAVEIQNGMIERNAGVPPERRIAFRIGVHLGDVVEEADGDLMGDGVNVAARLEGLCEPGGLCLSEDAWRQVRDRIQAPFADLGERELKNIARPMRAFALRPGAGGAALAIPQSAPAGRETSRLSIVVLPFVSMGGDAEQEYFVDAITDSLTTDLSRIRGAFVIARNTAFTFKGKAVDVKALGRELNVRYVLEGSVQRRRDHLRVNVQFVDAESGGHVWAERFDKPIADIFEMQDEIVARLANQLGMEFMLAEARRAERTANPDSLSLVFQSVALVAKGLTWENMTKARALLERALALDPEYVLALVQIAFVDFLVATYLYSDDRAERLAAAEAAAVKAVSLAPDRAMAHFVMGTVVGVTKSAQHGIAECERALAIDPNLASAHAGIGAFKMFIGRAEETESHVQEALRLSPRDPAAFYWRYFVATSKIVLGRYEEAIVWLGRSIEDNRNNPMSHLLLAAALALLGRVDEAQLAAKAALALNPQFSIARYRSAPWSRALAGSAIGERCRSPTPGGSSGTLTAARRDPHRRRCRLLPRNGRGQGGRGQSQSRPRQSRSTMTGLRQLRPSIALVLARHRAPVPPL